jgi:UDP-2,3-diacylglucosamine pyrophosphatase LpxH
MRIFALSDIHVDDNDNMMWLDSLSEIDYTDDTLILAGDISDNLDTFRIALSSLRDKFAGLFFVPGNHELWIRRKEYSNSVEKFWRVLESCNLLGVQTRPGKIGGVWIVPLFSWYLKPEEGGGSLYAPKPGEDPTLKMWSDNYLTRWPALAGVETVAAFFLRMNEPHLRRDYDAPVLSFSHFLPRAELIYSTQAERPRTSKPTQDSNPGFNFSRVAGCAELDEQIRRLGSVIHVYGHQHRNRHREIDDVLYISYCLGYSRERERGQIRGLGSEPKLIWEA